MEVIVFSMEGCPHCDNLKEKLTEKEIKFTVKDVDENEVLYESFSKKVESEYLPAILIGKKAFIPERSFQTIEQAVEIIQTHLSELSHRGRHLG
jgi:glutaredoxin